VDENPAAEIRQIGRATRFALACIVGAFSYFSIRANFCTPAFAQMFADMLSEDAQLPAITRFVFAARYGLLALSCGIPIACIALLFTRNIAKSIYWIGVLGLVAVVQWVVVFSAMSEPLIQIINKMQEVK
jgi:type II secretory pathway component PulF